MFDNTDTLDGFASSGSITAAICEQARLHGVSPEKGEFDPREVWDAGSTLAAVYEAFTQLADEACPTGFQLADERGHLLWGFVNLFHQQIVRLEREIDLLMPELQDLQGSQDGSEIHSHQLEQQTHRVQNLTARRDAFEGMRDTVSKLYLTETGSVWRPRLGTHVSKTGTMTASVIEARDFTRAQKDRELNALAPAGTLIAIAGGKEGDPDAVFAILDKTLAKYEDMVLVHGGTSSGIELFAARWAESKNVKQVVCKPDWNKHGKAAPFRRNEELVNLLPVGLIAFPGSGITANLVDKAEEKGIRVHRVGG